MKQNILVMILMLGVMCRARHVDPHHHSMDEAMAMENSQPKHVLSQLEDSDETDIRPIELIKSLKTSWFVPLNTAYVFKASLPCDDGYKRDLLGICREVWD